jgi:glutaredoxin
MLTLQQMQDITKVQNVIFYKPNCPFCVAAQRLLDTLVAANILNEYSVYSLGEDYDNETLAQLALSSGWEPDGVQAFPSKPQIFVQAEYIGGNFELYKSRWNVGEGKPNLKNPMRF